MTSTDLQGIHTLCSKVITVSSVVSARVGSGKRRSGSGCGWSDGDKSIDRWLSRLGSCGCGRDIGSCKCDNLLLVSANCCSPFLYYNEYMISFGNIVLYKSQP